MKRQFFQVFFVLILISGCSVYRQALPVSSCSEEEREIADFSRGQAIKQAMEQLIKAGVPGCAIAVYSEEGWWTGAAGLASIENKVPMQSCHLQYMQSISKTYMAVAVLQLYEQGRIELDAPMTSYLPEKYSHYISRAEEITIRMLLNHTSGIPEYNFAPAYVTRLLQDPEYPFTAGDYLKYIDGKLLDFEPGSKYSYRNTNYVLLALLTDALTGDHARFIGEHIFVPLGLSNTFYRNDIGYLAYPELVNTYWDRHSNGIVENVSRMQRSNVASLIGDDGIVTTPVEAVKFLRGLLEGRLLKDSSLEQMKTWATLEDGTPAYGLGLSHTVIQGQVAYGHSGGGIGAGCELYYFPEKGLYVFTGINLGTVTDSPLHEAAGKARDQLYQALLN